MGGGATSGVPQLKRIRELEVELREAEVAYAFVCVQVAADGGAAAHSDSRRQPRVFLRQCIAEGSVGDETVSPAVTFTKRNA